MSCSRGISKTKIKVSVSVLRKKSCLETGLEEKVSELSTLEASYVNNHLICDQLFCISTTVNGPRVMYYLKHLCL